MTVDHPESRLDLWSSTKLTKLRIWLLRPMFKRDEIRLLRISENALAAERERDYFAAMRHFTPSAAVSRNFYRFRLELVSVAANYPFVLYRYHLVSQKRRQAAVKRAERLFEVKNGRLPRPDELVPDYLPSLPLDPMSAGWTVAGTPAAPTTAPNKN